MHKTSASLHEATLVGKALEAVFAPGKPRRGKRCTTFQRLFARLSNFRRPKVRYEGKAENYPGFVRLYRVTILLGHPRDGC